MKRRFAQFAIALALAAMMAACGGAGSSTTTETLAEHKAETSTTVPIREDIEAALSNWIETNEVVGVVAAVAVPGQVPSVAAAGWSDRESEAELSAAETFRIGSITKMFTAVVVLDLVEEGVIALEDSVADYVVGAHPDMTIVDLLSHTSGLRDIDVSTNIMSAIVDPSSVAAPADVIAQALADGVESEPGSRQTYSSINYLILGTIVEEATGQSYEAALQQRVLDPLGLDHTGLDEGTTQTPTPYDQPPGQVKVPLGEFQTWVGVRASWAAGGLVSTVNDLVTFADAVFGGEVLSPASLALMLDTSSGPRDGYGLGVSDYMIGERIFYGHNGRSIGFASSLRYDPITGITVVVLANDGPAPTADLATQLMQNHALVGNAGLESMSNQ